VSSPVALGDAARALRRPRGLPPRAVAVTFDDGYRDNLHTAKPLLERHAVPATVFVASGYVGAGREFWWDELERLLVAGTPAGRPGTASVDGERIAVGSKAERAAAYARLAAELRRASLRRRDDALAALRAWAGEPEGGRPRPDRLAVDHDELRRLDGGAVEVGAHTRHHLSLAAHPAETQRADLLGGTADLQEWLARPVPLLAYPFGSPGDVDAKTMSLARRAGFSAAVLNQPARATALTSPFALPRFLVRDWPAERFETWLLQNVLTV
jgi:peptidoglycan/xylan/chitin deacetylase (PgdA/CDA1 family)